MIKQYKSGLTRRYRLISRRRLLIEEEMRVWCFNSEILEKMTQNKMWYPLGIPNDNHSITLPYRNRTRCDWLEITRREEVLG